jgi:hypothetical protein
MLKIVINDLSKNSYQRQDICIFGGRLNSAYQIQMLIKVTEFINISQIHTGRQLKNGSATFFCKTYIAAIEEYRDRKNGHYKNALPVLKIVKHCRGKKPTFHMSA